MSEEARTPLLSRRNGRAVACIPCRLRKVACDHQRPICNRCRRRRQSAQCHYPELTATATSSSIPTEQAERTLAAAASASKSEAPTDPVLPPRPANSAPSTPNPGFFGFTSSTSVFEETESALALLLGATHVENPKAPGTVRNELTVSFLGLPVPLRETCLFVLRCLPGQSNEQISYNGDPEATYGWEYIAVNKITESLRTTFGDIWARGDAGLSTMAEILCSNTRRPICDEHSSSQAWLDQFCGKNLRWESIGLLWAHVARVSNAMDSMRRISLEFIDGKQSWEMARTCLENCIQLTRHFTEANDLLLDLCRRFAILCSIIDGDAEISSHAPHGVSVAMLTYLGLHALDNGPSYKPSLCSENKRRLAAMVFASDKLGVAFTGRPPLISWRYYSTPLPLDISDEDLVADEATLMRAVRSLDEQEWNAQGRIYPCTLIRARAMVAFIRDELIEVALGKSAFVTIDQLLNIKQRAQATSSKFPRGLVYKPQDVDDLTTDAQLVYVRIIVELDHLQNIFFAERLLLRHGHLDDGDLLTTSFDMVCLTLKLWIHKDRFSYVPMRRDYEWLLMAYGAPGGGILCQELLYPTFTGTHRKHSGLTRSSIVQQLSLLVGFLGWVRPSAPNGALCADSKAVIQRVLDHHLNSSSGGEDIIDSMDWGVFSQPDFHFQLLDTFEWMRTDGQ